MNNSIQEKAPFIKKALFITQFPSEKRPCETDIRRFHVYCLSVAQVLNMVTFQAVCFF